MSPEVPCGRELEPEPDHQPIEGSMPETDALLSRITVSPEILGGKPIIRGMRIPVELVLGLLAQGETIDSLLDEYPRLESEDILACFAYARAIIANESIEAVRVEAA
jgi:uncharacterized protein (DUF433 family)